VPLLYQFRKRCALVVFTVSQHDARLTRRDHIEPA